MEDDKIKENLEKILERSLKRVSVAIDEQLKNLDKNKETLLPIPQSEKTKEAASNHDALRMMFKSYFNPIIINYGEHKNKLSKELNKLYLNEI